MSDGIAGRRHMARVAELPCAVCRRPGPSLVHHIRSGQGMAQRASDWLTVPLCPDCHQGKHGIHGDRQNWIAHKLSELDALAETIKKLTSSNTFTPHEGAHDRVYEDGVKWLDSL